MNIESSFDTNSDLLLYNSFKIFHDIHLNM